MAAGTGLALLLLLALGVLVRQNWALQEEMSRVEGHLGRIAERLEGAVESAEAARRQASEAEQYARLAAQGRIRAEAARAQAQEQTRRAEQQSTLAREEAEMARLQAREARQEAERVRREREAELDRLQQTLNRIVETRRTALGLVMNLGSDSINFDFDKASLRPENRELLSRIAGVLLTSRGYRVQVYGHTDDVGTAGYNQELSERRARAVRDYLVEAGIDPEIMTVEGFGKTNPLVPGHTPAARAKNRRVEIGIVDTIISYEGTVRE